MNRLSQAATCMRGSAEYTVAGQNPEDLFLDSTVAQGMNFRDLLGVDAEI